MRDKQRDVLAIAILILGISLFHWRGIRPGQTFLPVDLANNNLPWRASSPQPLQNWLISDPLYEFYPFLQNDVRTLQRTGSWPVWNPRILLGHPVFADPLNQPFYPFFMVLGLALGAARGLALGLWLHAILAGTLTYGLLRTIRCRRPAALVGALTYALSGYMVTWFEATHRVSTLSWMPGILWSFELAIRRRSLRYAALAALMMSLAILGGQFQFAVTFSLFLGLYAVGRTIDLMRRGKASSAWPLGVLALTVGVGALLSAVQTIPFAEFLDRSQRSLSRGLLDSLPLQQLITLVVPDFYGNPATTGFYWGAFNFSEGTIYAGLPALLLACLAVFSARRFWPTYLYAVAIVVMYFAVGGPGVRTLGSVPILKYVSLHRSVFLLPLLIAILAALALSEPKTSIRGALLIGAILTLAVGMLVALNWPTARDHWQTLRGSLLQAAGLFTATAVLLALRNRLDQRRPQVEWSFIGLVFVDLFLFGSRFNPAGPVAELMPATPAITYLREHAGHHRVVARQLDDQVLFGPNALSIYNLAEPGGYSSLVSARLQRLVEAGDPEVGIWWMAQNQNIIAFGHPSRRLLDLLQGSFVASPVPRSDPGVRAEVVIDECTRSTGEIGGRETVSGDFVVRDTAINRLDLRFRVYEPKPTDGTLVVRLWRGTDRRHLILEERLDVERLEDQGKETLYFAPERDAPGQTYVWEVAAEETIPYAGVGLCTDAEGRSAISVYGVDWAEAYAGEVYIHERLAPMPRAYVVYATEHISGDRGAISRLLDESFDLRNVAVTAEPVDLPSEPPLPATQAEIVEYRDTRVVINAAARQRGLLVLGDQFYPGWRAYIDGQPATVHRVNYVMRGLELPPGEHVVVFRFEPQSLRIGAGLSLIGIAATAILAALDKNRRKR